MDFHINTWDDLLRLEEAIREKLCCQTKACAFLESAKYLRIRLDMIRYMNNITQCSIGEEHYVYPSSNVIMSIKGYNMVHLVQPTVYVYVGSFLVKVTLGWFDEAGRDIRCAHGQATDRFAECR
jgi:hypothetical protein